MSRGEVPRRAKHLYESSLHPKSDLEENVGKMVIIDKKTGGYKVDKNGLHAADYVSAKYPNSILLESRIGSTNIGGSLAGVMERLSK
ncbi:hypothetical protein [Microcoleus sp. Pol12B4]|uniref:hypothetical protein n=1 Tax=Microcoleus sp. Pol12B4 TaxID=3055395 RepID=UPI002FD209BD